MKSTSIGDIEKPASSKLGQDITGIAARKTANEQTVLAVANKKAGIQITATFAMIRQWTPANPAFGRLETAEAPGD
jgi:hypothetical protein